MSTPVGILGATGAVGQRLVQLLDPHPEFEIETLTASDASASKPYSEAAKWRVDAPIPEAVAGMEVSATDPDAIGDADLLFSSLPSAVGERVEPDLCEAGYVVSSNSSNARLAEDVPLVIPEVNADHVGLLEVQRDERGWDGCLLKNPNCSTITVVPTLAALAEFGLENVHVATLQAVSGAGYSGVASMEIIDNVIPHIGGEEEKMETESRNRVPTIDGHLENVWVECEEDLSVAEANDAMREFPSLDLAHSPDPLIEVFEDPDRPQPRLDRMAGEGMAIAAGGTRETPEGVQYNCLAHNTIRGAAGASLLNGELLLEEGYL